MDRLYFYLKQIFDLNNLNLPYPASFPWTPEQCSPRIPQYGVSYCFWRQVWLLVSAGSGPNLLPSCSGSFLELQNNLQALNCISQYSEKLHLCIKKAESKESYRKLRLLISPGLIQFCTCHVVCDLIRDVVFALKSIAVILFTHFLLAKLNKSFLKNKITRVYAMKYPSLCKRAEICIPFLVNVWDLGTCLLIPWGLPAASFNRTCLKNMQIRPCPH